MKPVDEAQHSHSRSGEELDDKKKKKVKKESKMIKLKDLLKEDITTMGGLVSRPAFSNIDMGFRTQKTSNQKINVNEGGMGILSSDQADVLQGIVMRNKNKNTKAILNVALKSGHFKGVDKKELLGYIDGARQFVKYMKSHPMESVNEAANAGKNPNFDWQRRQLDMHYQMFNAVPTNSHRQNLLVNSLVEMLSLMGREGMKGDKEYKLLNKLHKDLVNVQKEFSRVESKIKKLKNQMPVFRAIDSFKGN